MFYITNVIILRCARRTDRSVFVSVQELQFDIHCSILQMPTSVQNITHTYILTKVFFYFIQNSATFPTILWLGDKILIHQAIGLWHANRLGSEYFQTGSLMIEINQLVLSTMCTCAHKQILVSPIWGFEQILISHFNVFMILNKL